MNNFVNFDDGPPQRQQQAGGRNRLPPEQKPAPKQSLRRRLRRKTPTSLVRAVVIAAVIYVTVAFVWPQVESTFNYLLNTNVDYECVDGSPQFEGTAIGNIDAGQRMEATEDCASR